MPGHVENDLSLADYLARPDLSVSGAIQIRKSARHYKLGQIHKDTAAKTKGSAYHCALLEPYRFANEYVEWTGGDKRSKAWKEFKETNEGLTILDTDEIHAISAMVASVKAHPVARPFIEDYGKAEVSVFFEGKYGVPCKARIDRLNANYIIEIKTTRDPSPDAFIRQSFNLGYHIKYAWYQRAVQSIDYGLNGPRILPVIVIAIESTPPYDTVVYQVPDYALAAAGTDIDAALYTWRKCSEENRWPGIADTLQSLDLPKWAYKEETEQTVLTIGGEEVEL